MESPATRAYTRWLGPTVYAASAGAIALVAKATLFPFMSGDSDEAVYVYQARMLVQGHVTLSARVHSEFFHPWLFGQRGGRLFSQYQPGWPAIVAVAHVLGSERLALAIAAAAAVTSTWFLAREIAPGAAIFAAGLLIISPIFVVHSALYLSYLWTTSLVVGGTAAAIAAARVRRAGVYLTVGALFGLAQLTRPLDAAIVAVPAFVYIAIVLRPTTRVLRSAALWIGAGLLPFLVVTAVFNAHVTGNPARFPLQAAEHLDDFGFGPRKMLADQPAIDYTPRVALDATGRNAAAIPRWFAGGGLGVVLAAAAVARHRKQRETWLLVAIVVVFPAAYFFWWATTLAVAGARNGLGPHYYVPTFAGLAVLAGWTISDLAHRSRVLPALALVAMVGGTLTSATTVLDNAHETTDSQRGKYNGVTATRLQDAVVVMRADPRNFTLVDFSLLVGNPALTDNVLYAIDRGPRTVDLAAQFPTRHLYQLVQRAEPGHPLLAPSYVLEPLRITSGASVSLRFDLTNTDPVPEVIGYVAIDGRVVARRTLDTASRRGRTDHLDVVLVAPGAPDPTVDPGVLVARVGHDGVVTVGAGFGPDDSLEDADVFERRYNVGIVLDHPHQIGVQAPGLHFHLYRVHGAVWVRENVGPHLGERG